MNFKLFAVLFLVVAAGSTPAKMAAQDTGGPDSITKTLTLTGKQPGGFNIRAVVNGQANTVPMNSGENPNTPQAYPAQAMYDKQPGSARAERDQAAPGNASFFNKIFGGDESHHNPLEGAHTHVPSPSNPNPPGTEHGHSFPGNDNPYVCHNYVAESLTGKQTINTANPEDIVGICTGLGFHPTEIPPDKKNTMPETFPPGTVIQYLNHVGIIGSDGKTLFNYTQAAPEYNVPAALNQSNPRDLWNKTYRKPPEVQSPWDKFTGADAPTQPGTVRPYANSPVKIWTPPSP